MTLVSAVVLAWQDEPWLEECIDALSATEGVDVEILVVDNGCTDGAVEELRERSNVRVFTADENLGFAGGCNFGARHASGSVLVFVNSDAIVRPYTLQELVKSCSPPDVAIASASVRLAEEPDRINTAGNPIHYLGFSWTGGIGESADHYSSPRMIAGATGSCMALRREAWEELEGFCEEFFAYHEDAEISWRAWISGKKVVYAPEAVVLHHYEPSRNREKSYLVERNRAVFVLTLYERRTLLLLLPLLLAVELGLLMVSAIQGWLPEKVRGIRWLLSHIRWLRERRSHGSAGAISRGQRRVCPPLLGACRRTRAQTCRIGR